MITKVTGAMIDTDTVTASNIAAGAVGSSEIGTDAVGSDEIAANAVGASELADNAVDTNAIADSAVTAVKIADSAVTAVKLAGTLNLSTKTLTLPAANTPAFTKSFTSANQTITTAGTLSLAHSLGGMPALIQVRLKCTTGEHGYTVGDEVIFNSGEQNAGRGVAIIPDATNIVVRYGSSANVFNVNHKTTGESSSITNTNWAMIVKAWA